MAAKDRRHTLSQNSMMILGASRLSGATKVAGFIISGMFSTGASSLVFASAMMVVKVKWTCDLEDAYRPVGRA